MKIFVVGARGIPNVEGGAEKNAEALFPRVVASGYEVTLFGLSNHIKRDEYKGVRLIKGMPFWLLKTEKLLYYAQGVVAAFRFGPDIVHLQGLGAAVFLWLYKLLGYKVVVRYGSADYLLGKWGLIGKLGFRFCEFQLRFADAIISVAPALTARLRENGITRNIHEVPNAVDRIEEDGAAPPADDRPYILAVGRVTGQKNIDTLIRSFLLFKKQHPEFRLLVAGGLDDVDYVNSLKDLVGGDVVLLGRMTRGEVAYLLKHCAVYANVSHHEGSSNATLEAIGHNCPILLSDIPENRDMKLQEAVFIDKDDPAEIAARMAQAIDEPDLFRVREAGFLTWDDVAQRTISIYREISANKNLVFEVS